VFSLDMAHAHIRDLTRAADKSRRADRHEVRKARRAARGN